MTHTQMIPSKTRFWWLLTGALYVMAATLAVSFLAKRVPPTPGGALAVAAVVCLGTLAVAAWMERLVTYPKGAYRIGMLLLAVTPVAGALFARPEAWLDATRDGAWMYTWIPVMLGSVPPRSKDACAAAVGSRLHWVMIGGSLLSGALLQLAAFLP